MFPYFSFFQVFITIGFLIHSPPTTEIIEPIPREPELTCNKNRYELAVSLTYNVLLIIVCSIHAFLTRHVPKNFNESRFIGFSIYTTLVIWLFFIPAYIMVPFSNLKVVIVAAALVINATVTLIFLFVVKLYALLYVPFLNIDVPHKPTEKSWPPDAATSWAPGSRRSGRRKSRVHAISSRGGSRLNEALDYSKDLQYPKDPRRVYEYSERAIDCEEPRPQQNFQEQSFYTHSISYGNSKPDIRPPVSLTGDEDTNPFRSFVSTWL